MKNNKIFRIAMTGVFAAVVVITAFIPLRTLGLEITFAMVPIAVGAIVFGPSAGATLGAVFGIVSFLQCVTGYSPFGAMLFTIDPFFAAVTCIPTRILAGWIAGLLFKAIGNKYVSHVTASLAAPLLNTVFFMGTLTLLFYNTEYIQGFVSSLGATNPFTFILLFVGINGLVELICGFIIALPASIAVSHAAKRMHI